MKKSIKHVFSKFCLCLVKWNKESYKIICEANDNKINKETFIQYILSCVNKEYGNKFSNVIDDLLRKEFK